MTTTHSRAVGCLLGLACGDALGRPVEFQSSTGIADQHGRVDQMYGDGTHGQPAGTVTDDTELALALARSLADTGGFDAADVADRYVAWYESGPFDVGLATADALRELRDGADPADAGRIVWERRPEGQNAGNGSLMRCAPLALATPDDERRAAAAAADSRITHADPRCVEGCVAYLTVLDRLLSGADPESAVDAGLSTAADRDAPRAVRTALANATDGQAASLETSGYVVHTLETALYDAATATTAEEAIVTTVSRGGDTDTLGAVAGAAAGARFGADAIPDRWLDVLDVESELRELAETLIDER
ncbi:ADP-ribosylglycohydrolase family protein [Halobaculum sp. MBLA0143]|uniref:ADP-ribosylglycohydrolase family protein n=1 Tax=Halobaculum sp. MBLA0143 TaxID=3079933 RepID=UPI0035237C1D